MFKNDVAGIPAPARIVLTNSSRLIASEIALRTFTSEMYSLLRFNEMNDVPNGWYD